MSIEIINLIFSGLSLLALVVYAYLTYLIVKETYEPYVSFTFKQSSLSKLQFNLTNKSKVEVEVFGKLWARINNEYFENKDGFYGNTTNWILQPFTENYGYIELKKIINKKGIKLEEIINKKKISSIVFNFQIKYRKIGKTKWKISSPQEFGYNFENNEFWLNV